MSAGRGSAVSETRAGALHIAGSAVPAGAAVKQRSQFADGTDVDGFPAVEVGRITESPPRPTWALRTDDLPIPASGGSVQ